MRKPTIQVRCRGQKPVGMRLTERYPQADGARAEAGSVSSDSGAVVCPGASLVTLTVREGAVNGVEGGKGGALGRDSDEHASSGTSSVLVVLGHIHRQILIVCC